MEIDKLRDCDFSELLGNTIELVKGFDVNSDEILFKLTNGKIYKMYHRQECCEVVYIDDIVGDVEDIIGSPILMAEESSNHGDKENSTWTFYKLATIKGYVTIKWYGESNGCYSEEADFAEVIQKYNYHQIGVICKEISDLQGVIIQCKQEEIFLSIRPNRKELEKKLNEIQDSAEASLSFRKEQFIKLISPIL